MSAFNSHNPHNNQSINNTHKKSDLKSKIDSLEEKVLSFKEELMPQPNMKKNKELLIQIN